jgi:hypothetical protein
MSLRALVLSLAVLSLAPSAVSAQTAASGQTSEDAPRADTHVKREQSFEVTVLAGGVAQFVDTRTQRLFWWHGRLDLTLAVPVGTLSETGAQFWVGYGGTVEASDLDIAHRHGLTLGVRNGHFRTQLRPFFSHYAVFLEPASALGVGIDAQVGAAWGPFVLSAILGVEALFPSRAQPIYPYTLGLAIGFTTT